MQVPKRRSDVDGSDFPIEELDTWCGFSVLAFSITVTGLSCCVRRKGSYPTCGGAVFVHVFGHPSVGLCVSDVRLRLSHGNTHPLSAPLGCVLWCS